MLLFATQYLHGKGDFLSLNIVDEYLEFRFDLGDGPVTIRYAYQMVSYINLFLLLTALDLPIGLCLHY